MDFENNILNDTTVTDGSVESKGAEVDFNISGEIPNTFNDSVMQPALDSEKEHQESLNKWRNDTIQIADKNILNFDNFNPSEREQVRKQRVIRAYMEAEHNLTPKTSMNYQMARSHVSSKMFGEYLDDDQLFTRLQERAQTRKDERDLDRSMANSAFLSAMAPDDINFDDWGAENIKGSISGKKNAEYIARWNEHNEAIQLRYGDVIPDVNYMFQVLKRGGGEQEFSNLYYQLDEEEREKAVELLGITANALPADKKRKFFSNFKKQATRDASGLLQSTWDGIKAYTINASIGFTGGENQSLKEQGKMERGESGFRADLRNIQQGIYDPIEHLHKEGTFKGSLERGIYATPGVFASSATAIASPFVMYAMMEDQAYQDYRQRFKAAGMSEDEAMKHASSISMFTAAPSAALERVGGKLLLGKMPFLDKAITKISSKITNRAVKLGSRATIGALQETLTENAQGLVTELVQDTTSALNEDIPDVEWNEVFDGYGHHTLTTFFSVLPLSIFGAGGGFSQQQRIEAFSKATDTELKAYGADPADIAKFRQAEGNAAAEVAIDRIQGNLKPKSETAIEATKEQADSYQNKRDAEFESQRKGLLMGVRTSPDSELVEVYDSETGDVLARDLEADDAANMVTQIFEGNERKRSQYHDQVVSQIQGSQLLQEGSDSVTEIRPFDVITETKAAEEFAGSETKLSEEMALRERVEGGDGNISQAVFGASLPAGYKGRVEQVNAMFGGSNLFTAIHEHTHEVRRRWARDGSFSFIEQVDALQNIDSVLGEVSFLPSDFSDMSPELQETAVDEGISQLAEVFALRTSNGEKTKFRELLNKNLSAQVRAGNKGAIKLKSFIRAMREWFTLNLQRSQAIKKAEREGKLDSGQLDELQAKIFGTTPQQDYESAVEQEYNSIVDDNVPFSVGNSKMADSLITDITKRVKNPEAKVRIMGDIITRVSGMKRDVDRVRMAFGKEYIEKAVVDPVMMTELKKQASQKRAELSEKYENEVNEQSGFILEQEDLAKLKNQPLHAYLAKPNDPLHGQLMSKSQAEKQGKLDNKAGDYDGAASASKSLFGGTLMPDQAAAEMFEQGLIPSDDVNVMWEALEKEQASVSSRKKEFKTGKEKLADARQRARGEASQWLDERIEEQKRDHNPRTSMLRSLAMYDAILMALPTELRGKVGGYVQLAKLKTDESRLKFMLERMDKLEKVVDKWATENITKEINKLFKKAEVKKTAKGVPKGKLDALHTDRVNHIKELSQMTQSDVDSRLDKLNEEIDGSTKQEDADKLMNEMVELMAFGNIDGMKPHSLESFHENLSSIVATGKMIKEFNDEQFKIEMDALKETINLDITGGGGVMLSSESKRRAETNKRYKGMNTFHRQNISFEWLVNDLARENKEVGTLDSDTHKNLSVMVHKATHSEKRENMATQEKYRDFLSGVLGGAKGLALSKKIDALVKEQEGTGVIRMDYGGLGAFTNKSLRAKNMKALYDGNATAESLGLNSAEEQAARESYEEMLKKSPDGTLKDNRVVKYQSPNVGRPDNLMLSQNQAINLTMLFRQEGLNESMIHEGYTEETMAQMEDFLSDESKQIREWLTQEYADNHGVVNKVFREANGVSLPQTGNYSPARRKADGKVDDLGIDSRGNSAMSTNPSFTISRTKNFAEVDQSAGALDIYMQHMAETNHYVAWAQPIKKLRTVFSDKTVKQNISDYRGESLLGTITERVEWMADGGNRKAKHILWLDKLRTAHTYSSLAYNWTIALKQLTSLPAYAFDMSFTDFGKYGAKFTANPVKNIKEMMNNPYVKTRFKEGYERDVIDGLRQDGGIITKALQTGMILGKAGDIVPVMIGGWMAKQRSYDAAIADGMSEADAQAKAQLDMEMTTDRAQQAGDMKDLSSFQGGGSLFKLFTMYKTSPRQYYANVYNSMLDAKAGKKGAAKEFGRRLMIGQIILPLTFQFVSDILKSPFEDDEDKFSPENYFRAMLLGPLNGLFIAGDFAELMTSGMTDADVWAEKVPVLDGATKVAYGFKDFWRGDFLEGADDVARGIGKTIPSPFTFYDIVKKELKRLSITD